MKQRCMIIAEAGINHNGNLDLARSLITAAADTGADAIKFQTYNTDALVSKKAKKAEYQSTKNDTESQHSLLKRFELSKQDHLDLVAYAQENNIQFLSSPFDLESIDLLVEIGIPLFKIPSSEINNIFYLKKIAGLGKPLILSSGMATLEEVKTAVEVLVENGANRQQITVLQCNTFYPTPFRDVNLRAMETLKNACDTAIGLSDHTQGIEIPIAAVALGATVIEKHFTLDTEMEGPDQRMSADPECFKAMVTAIRHVEEAMGTGIKQPSSSEKKNMTIARKSLHTSRDLPKDTVIGYKDLTAKRPGNGISSMSLDQILGKKTVRALPKDKILSLKDFQ